MKARIVNKYDPNSIKLPEKICNDMKAAFDLWRSLTNAAKDISFISFEKWYNGILSEDCEYETEEETANAQI